MKVIHAVLVQEVLTKNVPYSNLKFDARVALSIYMSEVPSKPDDSSEWSEDDEHGAVYYMSHLLNRDVANIRKRSH